MLTVNCSDGQISLNNFEIELSVFFKKCVEFNEKSISLPFSSSTVRNYIYFLLNIHSKVDLGGEFSDFLNYVSEPMTIDMFVDNYIEKIDPHNMMDIIKFYEIFNSKYDDFNLNIIYANTIFTYAILDEYKFTYSFSGKMIFKNISYVTTTNKIYEEVYMRILCHILPTLLFLVKKDKTMKEKYILTSMLKFYFFNRNKY
ncbi:hypothetical protein Catovirus_1_132 [Catovirus CTV1]|uniref:Uncharacterized protein n=1 Tax=Catovirus CTV1 TaxID=1977631 RepID=A0A1V0S8P7_9VIRU|nr:hypothetical protein Catovirus_1_132 [Catovirus CTV1]